MPVLLSSQSVVISLLAIPPSCSRQWPPWAALALLSTQAKSKIYIKGSLCRFTTAELPLHVYFLRTAQHVQLACLRHPAVTDS